MKGAPGSAGHAAFTGPANPKTAMAGTSPAIAKWRHDRSCGPALNLVRSPDDEIVPVRHLHLRQGLAVHYVVLADHFVTRENIVTRRVEIIARQRLRHLIP